MAKPVMTGDSQAVRDAFEHGRASVSVQDGPIRLALAAAIVELAAASTNSRSEMAARGT